MKESKRILQIDLDTYEEDLKKAKTEGVSIGLYIAYMHLSNENHIKESGYNTKENIIYIEMIEEFISNNYKLIKKNSN